MDLLRIATAGSVDDGKSTLIGRLLYETRSVPQDKIEAIEAISQRKGLAYTDLSLLTDGLIAEREQGITIDVAHIYFATPTRKFIIADTPGHIEYTRNMVTGASTASVSLILIDARQGVVEQTYRHFFLTTMMRMPQVVVCVNKMDLIEYEEATFRKIESEVLALAAQVGYTGDLKFIPLSALWGENITRRSEHMSWYTGPVLLEMLEAFTPQTETLPARFPVQYVIRPHQEAWHDFRGYAGRVASGVFRTGDEVVALPSGNTSRIASILKNGVEQAEVHPGESVTITLTDDVDISRGDMLAPVSAAPEGRKELRARICWMDSTPLAPGKMVLVQHGINVSKAKVADLHAVIDIRTYQPDDSRQQVKLNDIADITLRLARPVFADSYAANPANGALILIDEHTNNTIGVGFIS